MAPTLGQMAAAPAHQLADRLRKGEGEEAVQEEVVVEGVEEGRGEVGGEEGTCTVMGKRMIFLFFFNPATSTSLFMEQFS